MLFRFCLYGFLKNQQYYDPFLILAFRDKGLSFAMIGLLIGFREVCINIMEVPTGAIADVHGRRRAMIFSMVGYMLAFVVFGFSSRVWMLFGAMFLFSIGEAFRTGTHKAIIFDWLEREGRADEKTQFYGVTRSWSQMGSALSVVIAAILVFTTRRLSNVFFFCLIPYGLNIVNFLTYPQNLDGPREEARSLRGIIRMLAKSFRKCLFSSRLRRLLAESMGYEGVYKVSKDYLQPVLKATALALPVLVSLGDRQRTAVLVGAIYLVLYLLSSAASRHSGWLAKRSCSEDRAARGLWTVQVILFVGLGAAVLTRSHGGMIVAFILLAVVQNFWRPIQVSRIASVSTTADSATILSMDSQAQTLFAALFAPLLGLAVDMAARHAEHLRFLPVAVLGLAVAFLMLVSGRKALAEEEK